LGKFQALSCDWDSAPIRIVKLFMKHDKHDRTISGYIRAMHDCAHYEDANKLACILPSIKELSPQQVDELIDAYNKNGQVRDSFGFNGQQSSKYGSGILPHLRRPDGRWPICPERGDGRSRAGVGRDHSPGTARLHGAHGARDRRCLLHSSGH
jgi:hypothetical protein